MCEPAAKPQHASSVAADVSTSSSRTTVRMNRSAIADSEPRRGAAAIVALTGTAPHSSAQFAAARRLRPKTPRHVEAGDKQRMHGRPASRQSPPTAQSSSSPREVGRARPIPRSPGSARRRCRARRPPLLDSNVDRRRFYTASSTLRMSRYGPLYPRSQGTPASRP